MLNLFLWNFKVFSLVIYIVADEEHITPGSIITFAVTLRLQPSGAMKWKGKDSTGESGSSDKEEMNETSKRWINALAVPDGNSITVANQVHCSFLPVVSKHPVFWVVLGNPHANRVAVTPMKAAGLEIGGTAKTVRTQFQAPPKAGTYPLLMFIKSDSFVGIDVRAELNVQ